MSNYYLSFKNLGEDNEARFNEYYQTGTTVLKNFLNIENNDELYLAEKFLLALNYRQANNVIKSFDFNHLMAIHQALFGNIYPFAGQLRQANMGKTVKGETYYDGDSKSMFIDYRELSYHIDYLNNYLKSKNYLADIKDKFNFAKALCEVYLFINDIHAFREGNGRAQNEFIRQLAEKNGYILDIQSVMEKYKQEKVNYYQWFYEY